MLYLVFGDCMETVLVTGGCGFIGSNFVRHLLATAKNISVVNLDKLTYAGNPQNLADVSTEPPYRFVKGEVPDRGLVRGIVEAGISAIIHFAAESHVDRSIHDSAPFIHTNVGGTQVLLDA